MVGLLYGFAVLSASHILSSYFAVVSTPLGTVKLICLLRLHIQVHTVSNQSGCDSVMGLFQDLSNHKSWPLLRKSVDRKIPSIATSKDWTLEIYQEQATDSWLLKSRDRPLLASLHSVAFFLQLQHGIFSL